MLSLRPYQESGADFLFERDRAMILAPVGAGKTAITLTAMQDMVREGEVERWLVIAPKRVAASVWPAEAAKWAPGLTMSVCVGTPRERLVAYAADTQVMVINYDNLQWLSELNNEFDGESLPAAVFSSTNTTPPSGRHTIRSATPRLAGETNL